MTGRRRLPDRRASEIFDFQSMGMHFTASVSYYDDGTIAELFVDNHKTGSAIGTLVRDAAMILSFALQYGAEADAIRRALSRDRRGQALGPIGIALDRLQGQTNEADAP